jgi:hypothetical protein
LTLQAIQNPLLLLLTAYYMVDTASTAVSAQQVFEWITDQL